MAFEALKLFKKQNEALKKAQKASAGGSGTADEE